VLDEVWVPVPAREMVEGELECVEGRRKDENEPRNRDVSAQDGRIDPHRQRAEFERHARVRPLVNEHCWSLIRRKER